MPTNYLAQTKPPGLIFLWQNNCLFWFSFWLLWLPAGAAADTVPGCPTDADRGATNKRLNNFA